MARDTNLENAASTELLTERRAQELLPMSLAWFRAQRLRRTGPGYVKVGRRVFYPEAELRAYIERCPHLGGCDDRSAG